ncbi:sigma-70 region 4 domain-containing protein [Streptomyces sp. NA02950]|uniref:sigma-70 region 4 domain-containing protein n=1 Tax=Streptomyces sp. NA02950 TaxID=2742137 RepID=UPI001590CA23|nr:sigma-70 region 4 domain-containing protein [Streptomyces sp. NA02950]QKV96722.1 sigma-70 region 4 domain-containing protein [Streptomyces sp. NA02950]
MPANNRKPPAKMLEEARKCYELQVAGFSTYQIAEKMGFSQKTVRNRIDLHITKRVHPKVDEMRTRQITRLEAYIRSLWEKAMSGDEKAINAAIRTEERIARLFGTDSATAFVVKVDTPNDDIEVQRMIDQYYAKKPKD